MCSFYKRLAFFGLFCLLFIGVSVEARGLFKSDGSLFGWNENWHPWRGEVRLDLVNQQSDRLQTRLQGICYDVMEKGSKPSYVYLGFGFCYRGLIAEPTIGWAFRDNEWVGAVRLYGLWRGFRFYHNLEVQPLKTQSFYYISQMEWRLKAFLEIGLEAEGWADIDDELSSQGAGINAVLSFQGIRGAEDSKFYLETALQYRELGGDWKPQPIIRLIFRPKLDDHTPDHRRYRHKKH